MVVTIVTFLYLCFRQMVPAAYVKTVARPVETWGQRYLARQQARMKPPAKPGRNKPVFATDAGDTPAENAESLSAEGSESTAAAAARDVSSEEEIILFKPVELLVFLCVLFAGTWFFAWRLFTASVSGFFWASCSIAYVAAALSAGTDLKNHLVPNEIVLGTLALQTPVLVLQAFLVPDFFPTGLISHVACLLIIFVLLFLISRVAGGGLGLGDVKLLAVMGFCLGFMLTVSVVFYAIFLSFFAAIFLLVTRKKGRKQTIPFAPFIYLGFLLMIGFGL